MDVRDTQLVVLSNPPVFPCYFDAVIQAWVVASLDELSQHWAIIWSFSPKAEKTVPVICKFDDMGVGVQNKKQQEEDACLLGLSVCVVTVRVPTTDKDLCYQ